MNPIKKDMLMRDIKTMNESTKDVKAMAEFRTVASKVNDGNYIGLDGHKTTIAGNKYFCNVIICEYSSRCMVFQDVDNLQGLLIGKFDI